MVAVIAGARGVVAAGDVVVAGIAPRYIEARSEHDDVAAGPAIDPRIAGTGGDAVIAVLPQMTSLPPLPVIVSGPAEPRMTSLPTVPVMTP